MEEIYQDRCGFVEHNGRNLFYIQFSEDIGINKQVIRYSQEIISQQPQKSMLIVTYVKDANYDNELIAMLKDFTKNNERFVKASAVVGVDGFKKVILTAVQKFSNRNFEMFDDIDSAKDWLITQV